MIERRSQAPSAEEIAGAIKTPEGLTLRQEALAIQLFNTGAVQFGEFTLAHIPEPSPVYIDARQILGYHDVLYMATQEYTREAEKLDFDLVAGVPVGAVPFATILGWNFKMGVLIPRLDGKKRGRIEGFSQRKIGQTALLVEDAISTAQSAINAAEMLREKEVKVNDVIALVDRQHGGRERLKEAGLELHSIFTLGQLLDFYRRTNRLRGGDHQRIREGLQAINESLGVN